MNTATKPVKQRYRSPSVQVDAEVCLSEFSTRQLEDELRHRGDRVTDADGNYECSDEDGFLLSNGNICRIGTLLLCGQRASALELLSDLLEAPLGRRL